MPDGLHGGRVAAGFAVGEFGVGFGVVIVGAPLAEGFPTDLAEEFGREAAGEDGECGFAGTEEVVVVVDETGGLGFVPDGHRLGGGQFRREVGGGDGIGRGGLRDDGFQVVGGGGAAEGLDEDAGVSAAGKHLGAVVAGVGAVDERVDVEAAHQAAVVEGGEDVFDGGGNGVGEGGAVVFGEALEAGERDLEAGEDVDEFGFVAGHLGGGCVGVDLVDEFVEGDLVGAGAAGGFLGGDGAVFGGERLVFGGGGVEGLEALEPGASALPAGVAFDASVEVVFDDSKYALQWLHVGYRLVIRWLCSCLG